MRPAQLLATLCVLFLLSPAMTMRLKPGLYSSPHGDSTGRDRLRTSNALSRILGEIRGGLGDMMFMKTEVYLHGGIGYEVKVNAESLQSTGKVSMAASTRKEVEAEIDERHISELSREVKEEMNVKPGQVVTEAHEDQDGHEGHGHGAANEFGDEGAATLIPTPLEDFRGFIGDLEREVKPWRDPKMEHIHGSGDELLPWYRMLTLVDPQNVRGYMVGSWWLMAQKTDVSLKEAMRFVDEGVENNPDSFQLWLMKGRIEDRLGKVESSLVSWRRARELALAQRPAGGISDTEWSDYKEADARAAINFEVFTLRDLGRIAEATRLARESLAVLGSFRPLETFLREVAEGKYTEGEKRPRN